MPKYHVKYSVDSDEGEFEINAHDEEEAHDKARAAIVGDLNVDTIVREVKVKK